MNSLRVEVCLLAAALAVGSAGAAVAQNATTTTAPPATTTAAPTTNGANTVSPAPRTDDRGFDWGWLGLIGLAGLAGLTKRDRVVPTTVSGVGSSRP